MAWRGTRRLGASGGGESVSSGSPLARSKDLVIEELDGELLVYDQRVHRAHCLSNAAAQVWRRCDGRTSADGLGATLDLDADTVQRALEELSSCGLLEAGPAVTNGSTRREMTIRVAKAGFLAAAAPLIVSVAAPLPAHAVTLALCQSVGGVNNCLNGCCNDDALAGCCCCQSTQPGSQRSCVPAEMCPTFFPGFVGVCTCVNDGI